MNLTNEVKLITSSFDKGVLPVSVTVANEKRTTNYISILGTIYSDKVLRHEEFWEMAKVIQMFEKEDALIELIETLQKDFGELKTITDINTFNATNEVAGVSGTNYGIHIKYLKTILKLLDGVDYEIYYNDGKLTFKEKDGEILIIEPLQALQTSIF